MTLHRWLTLLPGFLTVTLTILLFCIYLFLQTLGICSTVAFLPLGSSNHVAVSVSIAFFQIKM